MNLILDNKNENYFFGDILASFQYVFKNFKEVKNTTIFIENIDELNSIKKIKFFNVVFYIFTTEKINSINLEEYDIKGDSSIFFINSSDIIKKYKKYNINSVVYSSFLLAENLSIFLEDNKDNLNFYIPKIFNNKNEIKFI